MEVRGAKVIGANFKFNQTLRDPLGVNRYVLNLHTGLWRMDANAPEVKLFPYQLVLRQITKQIETLNIYQPVPLKTGGQDLHWTEDGSFTNAPLSAADLQERKVSNVLIGHSETRVYNGVTDKIVATIDAVGGIAKSATGAELAKSTESAVSKLGNFGLAMSIKGCPR